MAPKDEEELLAATLLPGKTFKLSHTVDCTVVVEDLASGLVVRFPLIRGHSFELSSGGARLRVVIREPDLDLTGVRVDEHRPDLEPDGGLPH